MAASRSTTISSVSSERGLASAARVTEEREGQAGWRTLLSRSATSPRWIRGSWRGSETHTPRRWRLEVTSVLDLLTHYPRRYLDRTRQASLDELEVGDEATVLVTVQRVSGRRTRGRGRARHIVEARVSDGTGSIACTWFNQPWLERTLSPGTEVVLFGKVELYRGRRQMASPLVDLAGTETGRIVPLYPLSEKARITSQQIGAFSRGPAAFLPRGFRGTAPGADTGAAGVGRSVHRLQPDPRPGLVPGQGRRPSAAGVRRAAPGADGSRLPEAVPGAGAGRHRPRDRRGARGAVPRTAAVRADRSPEADDRRDRRRSGVGGSDAPAAPGRRRGGEDRRRPDGAPHRDPGRASGCPHGTDRGARRAAPPEHSIDARRVGGARRPDAARRSPPARRAVDQLDLTGRASSDPGGAGRWRSRPAGGDPRFIQEGVDFALLGVVVVDEQHRFGVEQRAAPASRARAIWCPTSWS